MSTTVLARIRELEREIERLRAELAEKDAAIAQAYEDGRISACNAGKPGCPRAMAAEAKLAASEAACASFLKDGETPAECIARWRGEAVAMLELLRQERIRSEKAEAELAARPTQWAYEQACNARNSRAERAEAACAQMRQALDAFEEGQVPSDVALDLRAAALATDSGKGWVSTEGAVEANAISMPDWIGCFVGDAMVPDEWAGKRVLIVLKPEDKP